MISTQGKASGKGQVLTKAQKDAAAATKSTKRKD